MKTDKPGRKGPGTPKDGAATSGDVARPTIHALLDPFLVQWGSVPEDQLASKSAEAARNFKRTKNPMFALYAAKLAAEGNLPLPRNVAEWLMHGIGYYLHGRRTTLDDALGLKQDGRASPGRTIKEDAARKAALGRMMHLHLLGATIPQAAALVHHLLPVHAHSTLESHYRRGGYTDAVTAALAMNLVASDPEPVLAEYPDTPLEVAQAKAAIRGMYAKRRT